MLSSPSLITYSDQSYYESDTLPFTIQVPLLANTPVQQFIPPQFQAQGFTRILACQISHQSPAPYTYQGPAQYPQQNTVQYPHQIPSQTRPSSPIHMHPPPPPFATPPKLRPVEEVIKDHPGTDLEN